MSVATKHSPSMVPIPASVSPLNSVTPSLGRTQIPAVESPGSNSHFHNFKTLRFANCELQIDKRELFVAGHAQRIQPRVFDLLIYLMKHRDRVVPRAELLLHVWKNAFVSDSVIARCVMKARRVIGDADPNTPIIRTLPRAGYRFVEAIRHAKEGDDPTPPAARTSGNIGKILAILPFKNLTGRAEFVWVEFGLAALLNSVVEAQTDWATTPILEVVAALESGFGDTSPACYERLSHAVGASALIAVQVLQGESGFELSYQLHQGSQVLRSDRIHGADLTLLTTSLGQQIRNELSSPGTLRIAFSTEADTFTTEAFTRAMRANEEQRFQVALDYLEVCMVADSHPFEIDVEYVASLAAVEHPETHSKAQHVLARAAESANAEVQARVLRSLSSYHHTQGNDKLARGLIHGALDLIERRSDDPLTASVLLERSEMAIADREFNLALSLGQRVIAIAKAIGEESLIAQCFRQEGVIAHLQGDPERALEALSHSASLSRSPKVHHADLARTLHRLAIVHRDAGRMRDSMAAIDEAVECASLSGMPVRLALVLAFQLTVHSDAGDTPTVRIAQSKLESGSLQQSRAGRFLSQLTRAWLSWRTGRTDDALRQMEPVSSVGREMRQFWLSFAIGMHAGMAIDGARYELARELIAEMEASRHFYEGTCLQGLAEFFRAALALAQDDRAEAWRLLRETLRVSTAGSVRSNACLAAAWLACEDRALGQAQEWLEQVPGWTAEHPEGIMALARYEFEKGHWDLAVAHQSRYVEHWPNYEVTAHQRQLLSIYQQAAATRKSIAAPRLRQLLTLRF